MIIIWIYEIWPILGHSKVHNMFISSFFYTKLCIFMFFWFKTSSIESPSNIPNKDHKQKYIYIKLKNPLLYVWCYICHNFLII